MELLLYEIKVSTKYGKLNCLSRGIPLFKEVELVDLPGRICSVDSFK